MNQEVILITWGMFIKRPPGSEQTSAELKGPERAGGLIERVRRLPLVRGHSGHPWSGLGAGDLTQQVGVDSRDRGG